MKKIIFILLLFFALPAAAYYDLGKPVGFVNDFAEIIAADEEQLLEEKLSDFAKSSSNEIAVVTIPDLAEDTIENFTATLFSVWGIGQEKNDNGVLLLVARDDREMRIEVGYGLEGALTDAQSYWIINDVMKPAFQEGNFYQGLNEATDKIIVATQGEYLPTEAPSSPPKVLAWDFVFWIGLFAIMWLGSILGRSKSWWAGGVLGGIAGIVISIVEGFFFLGLIALAILIPFGLLFDFLVSRSYKKHKARGKMPWWIGGGSGGSSGGFGGGGFGGFGGGSSGGGGASGSW